MLINISKNNPATTPVDIPAYLPANRPITKINTTNKFGITPAILNHVKKFTCKKYIIRKATNINKIDTAFFIIALLSLI